jgi:hypothetical protein
MGRAVQPPLCTISDRIICTHMVLFLEICSPVATDPSSRYESLWRPVLSKKCWTYPSSYYRSACPDKLLILWIFVNAS